MSAWGGFDLDDDIPEQLNKSLDFSYDAEAMTSLAESNPEAAKLELQKTVVEAARNGQSEVISEVLGRRITADLVDINGKDEAKSVPLIYASCFGHENTVAELLRFGADPNIQDANEWTALMWSANNNHLGIVKQLLSAGADATIKTSSGRSLADLQMSPSSATYFYLTSNGYIHANESSTSRSGTPEKGARDGNVFYERAVDPAEVDAQFDNDLKESAAALGGFNATSNASVMGFADLDRSNNNNLDVDSLAEADEPEAELEAPLAHISTELAHDFNWETFMVKDSLALPRGMIPEYLDLVITNIVPTLQKKQAPKSANALFLATRYFFYCGTTESFTAMTSPLARRIELVVQDEQHSTDLAYLSYWLTNCEAFLYYLQKDRGLNKATQTDLQPTFESLILLVSKAIQEATQKLLGPLIGPCLLDFDSIPEYGKVEYRDQWKLFRSKDTKEEDLEDVAQKHMLPPSHETRWKKPGPQRITSVLSSLLLLFQIYGVHSITQAQILGKLLYYMESRTFNKVVTQRKYLNRRKAMQIRLNVSVLEDWCRNQNFRPESVEVGQQTFRYKSLIDIGRVYLAPLNQILAWLQTFSGFGSDFTNVISTLQELKALNPKQLLATASHYRFETRESPLSKEYKHYLQDLSRHYDRASVEAARKEEQQKQRKEQRQKQKQEEEKKGQLPATKENPALVDSDDVPAELSALPSLTSTTKVTVPPPSSTLGSIDSRPREYHNQSCVLIGYELPIPEDVLVDENLPLHEHIPFFEEADKFWGDEDASGFAEHQGARFLVPYVSVDLIEVITKQMDKSDAEEATAEAKSTNAEEDDVHDPWNKDTLHDDEALERPEMASRRPMDGEDQAEDMDAAWVADGLAPVW